MPTSLRYGPQYPSNNQPSCDAGAQRVLVDSGDRRRFDTGAVRDVATGKGRFDLLCGYALQALAQQLEIGCQKYGDRNWEKGIPQSSFIDSGARHLFKHLRGDNDEDHLLAAFWNLHAAVSQRERMRAGVLHHEGLDDLPVKFYQHPGVYPRTAETAFTQVNASGMDGAGYSIDPTPVGPLQETLRDQGRKF